jgi:hypothetical protein
MTSRRRSPAWASLPLLCAAACTCGLLVGCSKQTGPPRYSVSGTVTFRGEPVPLGTIAFEPDTSRGNRGPAGYADIVAGRFQTHLGAVGGPHIVRISGASGPMIDEAKDTTLFSDYMTTCDLPPQSTTLDFDVPPPSTPRRR